MSTATGSSSHDSNVDADVIVVGGGLAGAATALHLRKAGVDVVVLDKAVFPRDKPCGEGLLPSGVARLRALVGDEVVDGLEGQPFRGILYHCHGVVARGDFALDDPSVRGLGLRRRRLDEAVRATAEARGARLVQTSAREVRVDDEGATVVSDAGTFRARVVVGADGPRSMVRHELGLDGGQPRRPRYALRQHIRLPDGAAMPDRVEVHVGDGHELYVTPVEPGVVGVAALLEKPTMGRLQGRRPEKLAELIRGCPPLLSRLSTTSTTSTTWTTSGALEMDTVDDALACGPLRVRSRDVFWGRAVLVGDAAGYVDAITGEGMSLALHTAEDAAAAVVEVLQGGSPTTAFARYRALRARAFRDHALLTFGLVELARRPFFARRAIARLGAEPALFSRLLAVNDGRRSLLSLGPVDALKLAIGARPALKG